MKIPIKTISARELNELLQKSPDHDVLDVRTPAEFREAHALPANNVPLDSLDPLSFLSSRNGRAGQPVFVICRTGSRAQKACEKFIKVGFDNVYSVEGGTEGWISSDLPVVRGEKTISLERQVRIAAGSLVLVGAVLAFFVNLNWIWLAGFIGAGLVFAGLTDTCGMGLFLAKMPWNRRTPH
jgi:rhodanese-related sulfurtransferase